jgi:Glycosyl hydrolases family 35/Glycosyl hydrolases family 2, sugar binding domain
MPATIRAGLVSVVILALGGAAALAQSDSDVVFRKPDRIRYDRHSYIIDGKPIFIYSGAIHYFRCPKPLWKDRLQKLKEAGLNCVETYLAWNYHEPEEPAGPDDYSKLQNMQDIGDFISTARDVGLYVIIRPGPYICAEWDRGGLPGWLMKYRPADVAPGHFLRGDSQTMLAWDRHWITAAAAQVRPHLVTNLPPGTPGVIQWQLENEYSYYNSVLSAKTRTHVLTALAQDAIDNGIDVPLSTCYTKDPAYRADPFLLTHVLDTTNSYPGFNMSDLAGEIESTAKYQPDKFRAMSELQGGWFAQVGGKLSDQQGHNAAQINQLTLTAMEKGVTSMNYYMFYGGSNFGYSAGRDLIQSYDYNAPLRECGGIGDRYLTVKAIGQMLNQYGSEFSRSDPVALTVMSNTYSDVHIALRRAEHGAQFYFVRTPQNRVERSGSLTVQPSDQSSPPMTLNYQLGRFGAKIFYLPAGATDAGGGKWLPEPVTGPARPASAPGPVAVNITAMRADAPSDWGWSDKPGPALLPELGVYDQRYVFYRAPFDLTDAELNDAPVLRVHCTNGDLAVCRINGKPTAPGTQTPLASVAQAGHNEAEILFENHGCPNFGIELENEQGLVGLDIVSGKTPKIEVGDWRMKFVSGNLEHRPEAAVDYHDQDWQSVSVEADAQMPRPRTSAIFRGTLNITQEQIAAGAEITFGSIDDKGDVYVNGDRVGSSDDYSKPATFDITSKLHEGANLIAVAVRNLDGTGGLYGGCYVQPPGTPLEHLQISTRTQGELEHWETADTANWQPYDPSAAPSGLLEWYRMSFNAPPMDPHAWVPWRLHLELNANAFVYFNGHLLGRYYSRGPQTDFWLPECWLAANNIVALQATPTSDGPVIKAIEVRPYAQFAEER